MVICPSVQRGQYSSTSEEESEADAEVTFIHGRNQPNGTFANNQTERPMSTPTTADYTTQGDPDASPSTSNLFKSTATDDEFLGTNNFFVPGGARCYCSQFGGVGCFFWLLFLLSVFSLWGML